MESPSYIWKTLSLQNTQFKFLKLVKHTIRCHPNLLNLATKPKYLSKLKQNKSAQRLSASQLFYFQDAKSAHEKNGKRPISHRVYHSPYQQPSQAKKNRLLTILPN